VDGHDGENKVEGLRVCCAQLVDLR
jgi:hypothetical protein